MTTPVEGNPVADALRALILSGDLPDGERLPSLAQLVDQYGVHRGVARRAVDTLRAEGLVRTHHGQGAYVGRFVTIIRRSPGRLSRDVWAAGRHIQDTDTGVRPRSVDLTVTELAAPDWVAALLGVRTGRKVVARSRRFLVDQRPVQLSTSYLPLTIVKGSAAVYGDTGPGGLYARLADLGHAPVRFVERVAARAPRPDERAALELPPTALVFEITRQAFTADSVCVEVNRMTLDASAYELEYAFNA